MLAFMSSIDTFAGGPAGKIALWTSAEVNRPAGRTITCPPSSTHSMTEPGSK
jgi:hypothetical protein